MTDNANTTPAFTRKALAAIDAPAGEGITCAQTCCQQCGGHYTPFTAEEAREGARAHATEAAGLRSDPDEMCSEYTERFASEHSRTAATFRAYADLLDRGNVLERAAKRSLETWDQGLAPHSLAMTNLRSVLAQRAKERS